MCSEIRGPYCRLPPWSEREVNPPPDTLYAELQKMLEDERFIIGAFFDIVDDGKVGEDEVKIFQYECFRPYLKVVDIVDRLFQLLNEEDTCREVLNLYQTAKPHDRTTVDREIESEIKTTANFELEPLFLRHFPAIVQKCRQIPTPEMKIMQLRRAYRCANPDLTHIALLVAEGHLPDGLDLFEHSHAIMDKKWPLEGWCHALETMQQIAGYTGKGIEWHMTDKKLDAVMIWALFWAADEAESRRGEPNIRHRFLTNPKPNIGIF